MARTPLLIAGIGNIFCGDDAFGCEVAQRLLRQTLPAGVRVVDFGIRGIDLLYALQDCDRALLIDTVSRGGVPGTLYHLEPEIRPMGTGEDPLLIAMQTHSLEPAAVLATAVAMGARFQEATIIGCEPATFGSENEVPTELSEPVQAAVEGALDMIGNLIRQYLPQQLPEPGAFAAPH